MAVVTQTEAITRSVNSIFTGALEASKEVVATDIEIDFDCTEVTKQVELIDTFLKSKFPFEPSFALLGITEHYYMLLNSAFCPPF